MSEDEIKRYLFHITGEFEEHGEGMTEEEAEENFMKRTVRELIDDGNVHLD